VNSCIIITLIGGLSANAGILTALAISLAILLSFHLHRHGKNMIVCFLVVAWMFCLTVGGTAAWYYGRSIETMADAYLDLSMFSLFIVYGCTGSIDNHKWNIFLVLGTTINAIASLIVAIIYIYLWCKVRKQNWSPDHSQCQEIHHFRIRLVVISILNLLCWWPACFMYWISNAYDLSVFDGSISPAASEPMRVIVAVTCSANPIIYTIASKTFLKTTRRSCSCIRRGKKQWLPISGSPDTLIAVHHEVSMTENTDKTSLFPEEEED
jgi:hypothetical protein